MREGISKHLALLAVELYEISERFIYELREKQHVSQDVFKYLPEFTINKNDTANNRPIRAEYYHQFVGTLEPTGDGDKYLYFNLRTQDVTLEEEISNSGIEDLFAELNFEELLSKFVPHPDENLSKFVFPHTYYLIVELEYITNTYPEGGYDYDMNINIIGYLDNNLQRQPFKIPTRSNNLFKEGDKVKLPFGEEGEVVEYIDLPWASRYNVKITKSNYFNAVGDVVDFFEKNLELIK